MSYEAAILWSIVRSLVAGVVCLGLASVVRREIHQFTMVLWLAPFFIPGLVVGYAYRNASLSLVQTPLLNELLYLAIVVAQLLPVAILALKWLPPAAMGASARYCLTLIPTIS